MSVICCTRAYVYEKCFLSGVRHSLWGINEGGVGGKGIKGNALRRQNSVQISRCGAVIQRMGMIFHTRSNIYDLGTVPIMEEIRYNGSFEI